MSMPASFVQNETAVLRLKKLKRPDIIQVALRHNRRLIQAELGASGSIDANRSAFNETLLGESTPEEVAAVAAWRMAEAGVRRLRKDAVRALEIVISLHPLTRIDVRAFFVQCTNWVAEQFGGIENVLSVDVHMDESAPHAHFIVLPLIDGKMVGSRLVGNRPRLIELQARFHREVAAAYGIKPETTNIRGPAKKRACADILDALRAARDPALDSIVWPVLRDVIEDNPSPFIDLLGLQVVPSPRQKRSMTDIFISPGRGPKRETEFATERGDSGNAKPMLCRLSARISDATALGTDPSSAQDAVTPPQLEDVTQ